MIDVSKVVLCGVVACAGMLGGCVADETAELGTETDPLVQEGEAEDVKVYTEGDEDGAVSLDGDVGIQTTVSFIRTCRGWRFIVRGDGAVIFADAASCRRRNGSWTGYRSWRGVCRTDVANIDGNLRC
jgi:hypothetical protein